MCAVMTASNFSYCPGNVTLSKLWTEGDLSPCLLDLTTSSLNLAVILAFSVQLWFFNGKGPVRNSENEGQTSYSKRFKFQVALNAAFPFLSVVKLLVLKFVASNDEAHGYLKMAATNDLLLWALVTSALFKLRSFSNKTKYFNKALRVFWTINFIYQNFKLFVVLDPQSSNGAWVLALVVTEYVASGMALLLGGPEKPPEDPKPKKPEDDEDSSDDEDETDDVRAEKLGGRVKILTNFMWQNKSCWLRMNVLVCVVTLLSQRVLYVYETLYDSYVFNSLTAEPGPSDTSELNMTSTEDGALPEMLEKKTVFPWSLILIVFGLRIVGMLVRMVEDLAWEHFRTKMEKTLDFRYLRHMHSLSLRWHLKSTISKVLFDRGTGSVCNILYHSIFAILPSFIDMAIAISFFVTSVSARFGFLMFLLMIGYQYMHATAAARRSKLYARNWKVRNTPWRRVADSVYNYETVKTFTNEEFEMNRYEAGTLKTMDGDAKVEFAGSAVSTVESLVLEGGHTLMTLVLVNMVVSGVFTMGDYYMLTFYLWRLSGSLNSFRTSYRDIQRDLAELEKMTKFLDEEPEIKDEEEAKDLKLGAGTVEFKNVCFEYLKDTPVLKDISFVVPGGKSLAIVGKSGSGKTSVLRLLMRFYEVKSGSILVDGQDISKVAQLSLRKALGMVPQDSVLLHDETLRDNIKYGDVSATDDQVIEAAKHAHIHDTILKLPQGYDSKIGKKGLYLSGGEKQRVAIARVLLKNPRIILLDEATSALDSRTERQLQKSLHDLCESRTSIIVAHRLSTVRNADCVLVLNSEGVIAEQGTHDELVARNGIYAKMWKTQLGSEELSDLDSGSSSDESSSSAADFEKVKNA